MQLSVLIAVVTSLGNYALAAPIIKNASPLETRAGYGLAMQRRQLGTLSTVEHVLEAVPGVLGSLSGAKTA